MKRHFLQFVAYILLLLTAQPAAGQSALHEHHAIPQDKNAAVIFAYHRIGEDQYPETNLRREQFAAHIKELTSGDYNVLPLPQIIKALKNAEKLPPNTVAITFDGGHNSIINAALPLLEKSDLPFTVFISTDHIDRHTPHYMDWNDIRRLDKIKGVTIGLHPASYIRLNGEPEAEITRQINTARARYREELGKEPQFFAYPFGEYSEQYRSIIEKQGFMASFGQQSGVAYAGTDPYSLPRFPMTESYGGLDRFRLTATALPLPVTELEPKDPQLDTAMPSIGFTVDPAIADQRESVSCFVSGQQKPEMLFIGEKRVELRLERPLEGDRIRINCTLPLQAGDSYEEPRWRWFGLLLTLPREHNSSWSEEQEESGTQAQADAQ